MRGFASFVPKNGGISFPTTGSPSSLEIVLARQTSSEYIGSVYFTVDLGADRTGGAVPNDGAPLVSWLEEWVSLPAQADNLAKLAASGADERHLFVFVPAFAEAPFAVADLLLRDDAPIPEAVPSLPPEVTHDWAAST